VLPFAALLVAIALVPFAAPRFWGRHYGKVALAAGAPVAVWFLFAFPGTLLRTAHEYFSFLCLVGSLFVVSGGILVRGAPRATVRSNSAFLLLGACLANVFGTTGASILLARPLLRSNGHRARKGHVMVFFIFLVGNVGGLLSPIGDPPLFLGYLQGVPFSWPLVRLFPLWLAAVAAILAVFVLVDRTVFRREEGKEPFAAAAAAEETEPLAIEGKGNLLLLALVVLSALLPAPWREVAMTLCAAASLRLTPASTRERNGFTWHPVKEVAILFGAIFATMMPALLILEARGGEIPLRTPLHFFWITGVLSSFLDNAPTYLTFFHLARSLPAAGPTVAGVPETVLAAISAGAVFMGANSYIGNAPNFMVRSIAEEGGVEMPSFLGYMAWAAAVLLPVFLVLSLLFFR
jgi:Na+/H+ antiporter NhaD/arsenite permease-like protein